MAPVHDTTESAAPDVPLAIDPGREVDRGTAPGTAASREPDPGTDRSRPRRAHEGIEENVRFLIIEVEKQLQRTLLFLARPTQAELSRIVDGDDYIDNLKAIIQSKSFSAAAEGSHAPETIARLRAYEVMASNLERIADFCEKVIVQVGYIDSSAVYAKYDFSDFLREVLAGVGLIERAAMGRDVRVAISICRSEQTIDHMYARAFKRILAELRTGASDDTQSLVTLLFIAHYLERMGDALLNVGEAILSAHLGERIKIGQLAALEDSLELTPLSSQISELSLETMGETKSGARVSSLSRRGPNVEGSPARSVIVKEGKTRKLTEERDSIARWEQLMPGLAPQIYSFHDGGEDGAILFEYLPGGTFESVLLQRPWRDVSKALHSVQRKLLEVWERTRHPEHVAPRFLEQLSTRFGDVLAVHPEFRHGDARIGDKQVASFMSLVERLLPHDESLLAPFSVFIHGDLNVDNVIYDPADDSVRFIDLHRSRMMDYVQDVSVFLVSHFRLQYLEVPMRRRINSTIQRFHDFARAHAQRIGDSSFDQRLALGVARSLATSTRFVLDRELARSMFLRSRYVLERLAELHEAGRGADYRLTRDVLVD